MSACPSCGSALVPGARFCGVCGTTIGGAAPAASPPAYAPPPPPGYPPPQGSGAPGARGPQFLQQYSEQLPMQERAFQGNLAFLNAVPFPKGIGLFALGGAVLCALGSTMPWVSGGGASISAWRVNLIGLLTFQDNIYGGLPAGLLYIGALVVLAPYFTHQEFPRQLVVLIGLITAGIAAFTLVRIFMIGQGVGFGFGLILSGAGGAGILYEGIKGPLRPQGAREKYIDTSKWQPGPAVQQPPAYPQQGAPPPPPPPPQYAPSAPPPQQHAPPPPPLPTPAAPPTPGATPGSVPPPAPPAPGATPGSVPPPAPGPRFCPNCGQPATGAFCGSCGSAVG